MGMPMGISMGISVGIPMGIAMGIPMGVPMGIPIGISISIPMSVLCGPPGLVLSACSVAVLLYVPGSVLWLHGRICSNDDFWQSLVRLFELGILLGSRKRLLALELSQDSYGLKIGSYI